MNQSNQAWLLVRNPSGLETRACFKITKISFNYELAGNSSSVSFLYTPLSLIPTSCMKILRSDMVYSCQVLGLWCSGTSSEPQCCMSGLPATILCCPLQGFAISPREGTKTRRGLFIATVFQSGGNSLSFCCIMTPSPPSPLEDSLFL